MFKKCLLFILFLTAQAALARTSITSTIVNRLDIDANGAHVTKQLPPLNIFYDGTYAYRVLKNQLLLLKWVLLLAFTTLCIHPTVFVMLPLQKQTV